MSENIRVKVSSKEQELTQGNRTSFSQHKFISDIYECEKQLYIFNTRLKELSTKYQAGPTYVPKTFKNSAQYKNYCKEYKKKKGFPKKLNEPGIDDFLGFISIAFWISLIIGIILGFILDIIIDVVTHSIVAEPGFYVIILAVIVGVILACIGYIKDKHKYKDYLYEVDCIKKENEKIVKNNNERYKYWENEYYNYKQEKRNLFDETEGVIIQNEIDLIEHSIIQTENTLESLYNLRINGILCLHPNYQGLVPISIIYGYFDTGRCSQLQGHEGAYNLYEDEKIKGMIIDKLDVVSNKLDNLNSSMLYVGQAIEECNSRLSDLESASNKMISSVNSMNSNVSNRLNAVSSQMSAIKENTANSAYYSEVSAEMTTFNTIYNLLND